MNQKIAVLLNTDKLGGAERSLLLQLNMVKNVDYTFFIPKFSSESDVEKMINSFKLGNVKYFIYPQGLYLLSRSNLMPSFGLLKDCFNIAFGDMGLGHLKEFDQIYLNGNKVAFLFFLLNYQLKFPGKITWHLRDYYQNKPINNLIWKMLLRRIQGDFEIVCNSHSVKTGLKNTPLEKFKCVVIYNPSGALKNNREIKQIETIGFVSMMAPWKGAHEVMIFAWLYEEELKNLGVKEIKIFGDNLYTTIGEHQNYKDQLKKISLKMPSDLIKFEGMQDPQEIFKKIDCLIHYSLEAEPFGRVLIEAYDAGVPVITTGLGGAGEILENDINGFKVQAFDRRDLFNKVYKLTINNVLRGHFIEKSKEKSSEIQKNIINEMKKVLMMKDAS
jgi:glycosyltransferase involved in cell wall biosynthesis